TYLKNRIQLQEKYLGEIRNSLGGQILAYVPEMERDVTGLPMIERLAGQLFENSRSRKSARPWVGTSRRTQNSNTFFLAERVEWGRPLWRARRPYGSPAKANARFWRPPIRCTAFPVSCSGRYLARPPP